MAKSIFELDSRMIVSSSGSRKRALITLAIGSSQAVEGLFIIDFSKDMAVDYQSARGLDGGHLLLSFGDRLTGITLQGIQPFEKPECYKGAFVDVEKIYEAKKLSSKTPGLVRMAVAGGAVYRGYMVAFTQRPLGNDPLNGYSFVLTIVGEKAQ